MLSREEACSLWTEYPAITDPSVTAWWPLCRSLRCVVCTSERAYFCASMLPYLVFLDIFRSFEHFFNTFAFSMIYVLLMPTGLLDWDQRRSRSRRGGGVRMRVRARTTRTWWRWTRSSPFRLRVFLGHALKWSGRGIQSLEVRPAEGTSLIQGSAHL